MKKRDNAIDDAVYLAEKQFKSGPKIIPAKASKPMADPRPAKAIKIPVGRLSKGKAVKAATLKMLATPKSSSSPAKLPTLRNVSATYKKG